MQKKIQFEKKRKKKETSEKKSQKKREKKVKKREKIWAVFTFVYNLQKKSEEKKV